MISLPCWELLAAEAELYRHQVVKPDVPFLPIEPGIPLGWRTDPCAAPRVFGADRFRASARGKAAVPEHRFPAENLFKRARSLMRLAASARRAKP